MAQRNGGASVAASGLVKVEWVEEEALGAMHSAYYKALKLPAARLYRSARVTGSQGSIVVGLGDFVHLSAGLESPLPYVARVAALFANSNDGTQCMLAQWLYRPSDVSAKLPSKLRENELFVTEHSDHNAVEVVLEVVQCSIKGAELSLMSTPYFPLQNAPQPHYVIRSIYDHKKHTFRSLTEEMVHVLSKYDDETALLAYKLKSTPRKSRTDPHNAEVERSSGTQLEKIEVKTVTKSSDGSSDIEKSDVRSIDRHGADERSVQSSLVASPQDISDDNSLMEVTTVRDSGDAGANFVALQDDDGFKRTLLRLQWRQGKCDNSILAEDNERAQRLEHIVGCTSNSCWCSSASERSLYEHAKTKCRQSSSCELCNQYLPLIQIHACGCGALSDSCRLPRCEQHKPSVLLEHAASCHKSRSNCQKTHCHLLKLLLKHASRCNAKDCPECGIFGLFLGLHDFSCRDKCLYPRCAHFAASNLSHPYTARVACLRAKKASSSCMQCFLYSKLRQDHIVHCNATLGQCSFPLCPGRRQPILADISSTVNEREEREPNKRLREYSSHPPKVGPHFQAAIPQLVTFEPSLDAQSFVSDTSSDRDASPNVKTGSIVAVEVPFLPASHADGARTGQYMFVRVIDPADDDGFLTCVPFDAAWPTDGSGTIDLNGVTHLLFRFPVSAIAHPVANQSLPLDQTLPAVLAKWTYSEVDKFTKILQTYWLSVGTQREIDWFDEAVHMVSTKTSKEILSFWYAVAAGIAHAPPGSHLCSKCLSYEARHACRRFFVCKNALCEGCHREEMMSSNRKRYHHMDELEAALWFCSKCCGNGGAATSGVGDLGSEWQDCQLVFGNDGYDESLAWNSRSLRGGSMLTEAEQFLDEVLLLNSHETYDPLVDSLITYGLRMSTADELVKSFETTLGPKSPELLEEFNSKFFPCTKIIDDIEA